MMIDITTIQRAIVFFIIAWFFMMYFGFSISKKRINKWLRFFVGLFFLSTALMFSLKGGSLMFGEELFFIGSNLVFPIVSAITALFIVILMSKHNTDKIKKEKYENNK